MKTFLAVILCAVSMNGFAAQPKESPELIAKGKTVFNTNCTVCHGEKGDGKGPAGVALKPPPRDFSKDKFKQGEKPQQIFTTVTKGIPNTSMAGFASLNEDDRWAVAYYVATFRKK